jgi:hypothetical protein
MAAFHSDTCYIANTGSVDCIMVTMVVFRVVGILESLYKGRLAMIWRKVIS